MWRDLRTLRRRARMALRQGRETFAVACLQRIVERRQELDSRGVKNRQFDRICTACFCSLGKIFQHRGDRAEALEAYLHALRLAPRDVGVHLELGRALTAQELHAQARGVFERAVSLDRDHAEIQSELGAVLYALRDIAPAIAHFEQAIRLDPGLGHAHRGLARMHRDRGNCDDALEAIARGGGTNFELLVEKAETLLQRSACGDIEEAIRALRAALNLRPRDVEACRLLLKALSRAEPAESASADAAAASFTLGVALQEAGDLDGAVEAYEAAVASKPDSLRAWLRLSDVYLSLREPALAIRALDAAIAIDPEHPAAHINLGWALRTAGDFARGWTESGWNYRTGERRRFEQPMWDGAPLGEQTLLLWADFALGDTIQDLRYLAPVKVQNPHARIVLECDRRLVPLIEANISPLADVVIATKAPLPAFDRHLPLRRLPEVLGIDPAWLPATVPYLQLDRPDHVVRHQTPNASGTNTSTKTRTIGLVWASDQTRADARIKSASLADFEPLLRSVQRLAEAHAHAGAEFRIVSLQFGSTVDELIALPLDLHVEPLPEDQGAVLDTARLMQGLDLVITVDTMAAHLAGALGCPVWVVAAYSPAWWLWHLDASPEGDGEASRWYATMRVFRQERAGDWASVMQKVCAALPRALGFEPLV